MVSARLERRIGQETLRGWRLTASDEHRAVFKRTSYGSKWVHALLVFTTAWWSFGVINLVYAVYAYRTSTEYKVVDDSEPLDGSEAIETLRSRYAQGELDEEALAARIEQVHETDPTTARQIAIE